MAIPLPLIHSRANTFQGDFYALKAGDDVEYVILAGRVLAAVQVENRPEPPARKYSPEQQAQLDEYAKRVLAELDRREQERSK